MPGAASPSTGAAARHAVAVVFARGTVRDGGGARAAFLLVGERALLQVERFGVGAENQEVDDEGEDVGGAY